MNQKQLDQVNKIYSSIHEAAKAMTDDANLEMRMSIIEPVAEYLQRLLLYECIQTHFPVISYDEDGKEYVEEYQYPVIELDISNLD